MDGLAGNIIDVIREEQIKLGYRRESIRLYYPLSSLNILLGVKKDSKGMETELAEYFAGLTDIFGEVQISHKGERFCIYLPEQVSEYVNENTEKSGFLYDFINKIAEHHVTIDEILCIFKNYSEQVCFETKKDEEFDYLMYFTDGQPDSYRYCLTEEGHHLIYHRYTEADYEELFGPRVDEGTEQA